MDQSSTSVSSSARCFSSIALLALARGLSRQRGLAGALAMLGAVTAIMLAAVFTVQMAVDGVALRSAIDTWTNAAAGPAKTSAFQVADGLRGLEKGLSGFFHLNNGITLITLGLSIALGRLYARWLARRSRPCRHRLPHRWRGHRASRLLLRRRPRPDPRAAAAGRLHRRHLCLHVATRGSRVAVLMRNLAIGVESVRTARREPGRPDPPRVRRPVPGAVSCRGSNPLPGGRRYGSAPPARAPHRSPHAACRQGSDDAPVIARAAGRVEALLAHLAYHSVGLSPANMR